MVKNNVTAITIIVFIVATLVGCDQGAWNTAETAAKSSTAIRSESIGGTTAKAQDTKADIPRILILNSYHPGYPWSDNELIGIIETFKQKYNKIKPSIEYLDFKNFTDEEYLEKLKELYRFKYAGQKIDLVMTIDDLALDFALRFRADIFPSAAIVFSGVNDFKEQLIAGRPRVTGVAEKLDIEETIKVALNLHPRTREILVIHDYTKTGLKTRNELEALIAMFSDQVNFRFIENLTISQIALELESLPGDALVLILSYSRDRERRVFAHQDVARLFRKHSPVPIYAVHEERLGFGIVGGSLQGGQAHGMRAAELALMVLAGEEQVPVELKSTSRLMFDYNELTRFSILLKNLPKGSIIINRLENPFEKYRTVFLGILLVIVVLMIIVGFLVINIIKRKRVENELRASEERYRRIVDDQTEFIVRWQPGGKRTFMNKNYCQYFCISPDGARETDFLSLIHKDDQESVLARVNALNKERPISTGEHRVYCPDGKIRWTQWTDRAIFDESGSLVEYQSVGRDITDRKMIEERLNQSLREKETLIKEVHHRVKNNLIVLQGLIVLQQVRLKGERIATEALEAVKQRITAMGKVHQLLYQSKSLSNIDFSEHIKAILHELLLAYPAEKNKVTVSFDLEPINFNIEIAMPCSLIINELFSNVFKHAFHDGEEGLLNISLKEKDGHIELRVKDNGVGMPEEFMQGDIKSLGLKLVSMFTQQIGGEIFYKRHNGSEFIIVFNVHDFSK